MNDFAESTVKHAVAARKLGPTYKWLEKKHPDWSNKTTIEHTGTVSLTAGLMSKAEIEAHRAFRAAALKTWREVTAAA
jgi:hypothetical protein